MLVDHERAWQRLKERVNGKQGIGIPTLLVTMAELEVECAVEEGLPERALRLYGVVMTDDLLTSGSQPAPSSSQAPAGDGDGAALPRAESGSKEAVNGNGHRREVAVR